MILGRDLDFFSFHTHGYYHDRNIVGGCCFCCWSRVISTSGSILASDHNTVPISQKKRKWYPEETVQCFRVRLSVLLLMTNETAVCDTHHHSYSLTAWCCRFWWRECHLRRQSFPLPIATHSCLDPVPGSRYLPRSRKWSRLRSRNAQGLVEGVAGRPKVEQQTGEQRYGTYTRIYIAARIATLQEGI